MPRVRSITNSVIRRDFDHTLLSGWTVTIPDFDGLGSHGKKDVFAAMKGRVKKWEVVVSFSMSRSYFFPAEGAGPSTTIVETASYSGTLEMFSEGGAALESDERHIAYGDETNFTGAEILGVTGGSWTHDETYSFGAPSSSSGSFTSIDLQFSWLSMATVDTGTAYLFISVSADFHSGGNVDIDWDTGTLSPDTATGTCLITTPDWLNEGSDSQLSIEVPCVESDTLGRTGFSASLSLTLKPLECLPYGTSGTTDRIWEDDGTLASGMTPFS